MERIVTTALVGTGQLPELSLATGTPVDDLTNQLTEVENERRLLLTAGAWGLYKQVGGVAAQLPAPYDSTEVAGQETIPACSAHSMALLEQLVRDGRHTLLPEAFLRLKQVGQRLPFEQLPAFLSLGTQRKDLLSQSLVPILGVRGVWLSTQNPAWSWVMPQMIKAAEALPEDAEQLWQEGSTGQRQEILRQLRAIDPAQARSWLSAVWKQEKADERMKFLATWEVGLSSEDEAMLEAALDDRSAGVRSQAAQLLSLIPGSALTQRMEARARALLRREGDKVLVEPPLSYAKEWLRDGIVEKLPHNVGQRYFWLLQLLAYIDPQYWEQQLEDTPEQLLAALTSSEWWRTAVQGLLQATIRHHNRHWAAPLWNCWFEMPGNDMETLTSLMNLISQDELEHLVMQRLQQSASALFKMPADIPGPWSQAFGLAYIRALHATVHEIRGSSSSYSTWCAALPGAALKLPRACFEDARSPIAWPDDGDWYVKYCQDQYATFLELLVLRDRIIEEIV